MNQHVSPRLKAAAPITIDPLPTFGDQASIIENLDRRLAQSVTLLGRVTETLWKADDALQLRENATRPAALTINRKTDGSFISVLGEAILRPCAADEPAKVWSKGDIERIRGWRNIGANRAAELVAALDAWRDQFVEWPEFVAQARADRMFSRTMATQTHLCEEIGAMRFSCALGIQLKAMAYIAWEGSMRSRLDGEHEHLEDVLRNSLLADIWDASPLKCAAALRVNG